MRRARYGVRMALSAALAAVLLTSGEARQYVRRGMLQVELEEGGEPTTVSGGRGLAETPKTLQFTQTGQFNMSRTPGLLSLSADRKNLYVVTGDALCTFAVGAGGSLSQIQELTDGATDAQGKQVQYFDGLTAALVSHDGDNVYAVGTTVMPGVGGITTLHRNPTSGMLSVMQQFRIDQRAGIKDLDGMIGANSVAASPDGRFVYVSSGGYYRDHNLLAFSRNAMAGGVLSPIQNIDVYNTSANRVLPSTISLSPDGKNLYVIGDNFAISTASILVYSISEATGLLTQVQEFGPLRATLLTSASFDNKGEYLYCTASLGPGLVLGFKRAADGTLSPLADTVVSGTNAITPPQGSYSASISVDVAPVGGLIFVAVEKDNVVYAAVRSAEAGRIQYYNTTIPKGRPVALSFNPDANLLYVSSAVDHAVSTYSLNVY